VFGRIAHVALPGMSRSAGPSPEPKSGQPSATVARLHRPVIREFAEISCAAAVKSLRMRPPVSTHPTCRSTHGRLEALPSRAWGCIVKASTDEGAWHMSTNGDSRLHSARNGGPRCRGRSR
jgi:hypothetical protein